MHIYDVFGLSVYSSIPLPELVSGNKAADVIIRCGQIDSIASDKKAPKEITVTPQGIYLAWQDVGEFLVRDGREIVIAPSPGVTEQTLRLFILGTTLAMLLHQQGKIVFHASVVDICGQAVAFVGDKGAGKSTMAAMLQARGHKLVSDDLLVVDSDQATISALPGFPQMKLWSNTITSMGYSPKDFPQLRPDLNTEKRGYRLSQGYATAPVPLKYVYILSFGSILEAEPIQPHQALPALMPHWYGARFGPEVLHSLGLANCFLQCTKIVENVPIIRLNRYESLLALPEVAQLVETQVVDMAQPN